MNMRRLREVPEVYEARQRAHYDRIIEAYDAHYSDEWSLLYRRLFLYEPLIAGIELRGRKLLDAMCGSGQTAEYLLDQGAQAYGLDISPHVMAEFRANLPGAVGVCGSILSSGFDDESFDAVFVTGGLHHVHPQVPEAVTEIHRILKPGGWFCFYEPHTGSLADAARKLWYRHDSLFEGNEAAVDLEELMHCNAHRFDFVTTRYSGGPAYLLVFNSMVFRVPLSWKAWYTRPLLWLERRLERIQGKRMSCFALAQWRKKA